MLDSTEGEERFSFRAAFAIMGLLSLASLITRIFGQSIFALEFEALILYLPTSLLLIAVLNDGLKRSAPMKAVQLADDRAA